MRHRTDIINRLPSRWLQIRPELVAGTLRYAGQMDGRVVVSAPSREAAIYALLRRAAEGSIH